MRLASGLLTPLQSDTLYGHFCWRLKEMQGEATLQNFIELYANGKPVFTLSDGLYEVEGKILFPKPIQAKLETSLSNTDMSVSKDKKIKELLQKKTERANRYILFESLQAFLDGNLDKYEELLTTSSATYPEIKKDLRVHVGIDRKTLTNGEGLLFEKNPEHLGKETNYVILLKVLDDSAYQGFKVESVLEDIFLAGFGKKKSSGYGAFEWIGVDEYTDLKEPEDCNGFYSLGNYLPSQDDQITDGFYRFFVKYGKLGETGGAGANPFKKPLIMMKQGSCFEVKDTRQFYGRITTKEEISVVKNVVQFGIPFTLNYKTGTTREKLLESYSSRSAGETQ